MQKSTVDPACTGQFSPLFLAYLSRQSELESFYSEFPDIEGFKNQIAHKEAFPPASRVLLAERMRARYAEYGLLDPEREAVLEQLKDPKTFTVTTGHQLNLFTGPLYFIYKIVSTVQLARRLQEAFPGYRFLPVYWMASEDHDFEEINFFTLDGKAYRWETEQSGPVGRFHLDASFQNYLQQLPFLHADFRDTYAESKTLAEAVFRSVHRLFAEEGLFILDADDAALKASFRPVVEQDLFSDQLYTAARSQTEALEALGFGGQIYPRPINSFYMREGLRARLEAVENGRFFHVVGTEIRFSREALAEELAAHPERFSPNVVLRPLYQEWILPNIAYLGGPAEVVYWLQLKAVFEQVACPFPIVMPRNFALVLDVPAARQWSGLGQPWEALFRPFSLWKKEFVAANSPYDFTLREAQKQLDVALDGVEQLAEAIDKTLEPATEALRKRMRGQLAHMGDKLRKAAERDLSVQLKRMEAVRAHAFPGGSPQERVQNIQGFYLENAHFIRDLYAHFDPLDFSFVILRPDGF
ncbi:MAG: bacillithiol biosynthesis cysteine-adding enzyme BshC [Nitritalea sp.]